MPKPCIVEMNNTGIDLPYFAVTKKIINNPLWIFWHLTNNFVFHRLPIYLQGKWYLTSASTVQMWLSQLERSLAAWRSYLCNLLASLSLGRCMCVWYCHGWPYRVSFWEVRALCGSKDGQWLFSVKLARWRRSAAGSEARSTSSLPRPASSTRWVMSVFIIRPNPFLLHMSHRV